MRCFCGFSYLKSFVFPFLISTLALSCSVGHMQSNSELVSNGSVRVDHREVLSTNTEPAEGKVAIPEVPTRQRCVSISSEIPNALREIFEAQSKKDEQFKRSIDEKVERDKAMELIAYTFAAGSSQVTSESARCEMPIDLRTNVVFVASDVNRIIGRYVTAVMNNSHKILKIKKSLELGTGIRTSIELCQDIRCNRGGLSSMMSFEIANEADLNYASVFTDTKLGINTSNDIRNLNGSSTLDLYLTDAEIAELIRLGYKLALTKASDEVR